MILKQVLPKEVKTFSPILSRRSPSPTRQQMISIRLRGYSWSGSLKLSRRIRIQSGAVRFSDLKISSPSPEAGRESGERLDALQAIVELFGHGLAANSQNLHGVLMES